MLTPIAALAEIIWPISGFRNIEELLEFSMPRD
jgi:hypothetical protein